STESRWSAGTGRRRRSGRGSGCGCSRTAATGAGAGSPRTRLCGHCRLSSGPAVARPATHSLLDRWHRRCCNRKTAAGSPARPVSLSYDRELRTTHQGNIPYPDRPDLWRSRRMATVLHLAACVGLALAGQIQEPQKKLDPAQPEPPALLVPPVLADDLKLDAQQRTKIDELEQEFQQQLKTA